MVKPSAKQDASSDQPPRGRSRFTRKLAGFSACAGLTAGMLGCEGGLLTSAAAQLAVSAVQVLPGVAAVMADTHHRTGSHMVFAEYEGLQNEEFVVLASADRVIGVNHPRTMNVVSNAVTNRLTQPEVGAAGFVPGHLALEYQYANPSWKAKQYKEIADEFTVDRIVLVEIIEYRLKEPGNAHLWAGVARARVSVVEADGHAPSEHSFSKEIRVRYPDTTHAVTELSGQHVDAVLQQRLVDRVSWLFYDHEEANIMSY